MSATAHDASAAGNAWRQRSLRHWQRLRDTAHVLGPSARLLLTTEAHTYAYSVAANCLLASLPFLFLMLWAARVFLPGLTTQQAVIAQLAGSFLPAGHQVLISDAIHLANRESVQVFSLVMLGLSSSGVFLPLEVALNSIWGFPRNRSYFGNMGVAYLLVLACGVVAYGSIVLASLGTALAHWILPVAWTGLFALVTRFMLVLTTVPAAILIFFLIYWKLPNGTLSAEQVFPAAVYTGVLAEILKWIFPVVIPWFDFDRIYASLTLAVILLIWGYIGALLLLLGASLSARGVVLLPAVRIKLPLYHDLRAWYASHVRT
ncbi:MAG: YihY/virulence factor BrkB family protein [Terriglobales bacterium]